MLTPDTPLEMARPMYVYFDVDLYIEYMPSNVVMQFFRKPRPNRRAEQAAVLFSLYMPVVYVIFINTLNDWQTKRFYEEKFISSNVYNKVIPVHELQLAAPIVMPPFRMYTNHAQEGAFNNAVVNYPKGPKAWQFVYDHLRQDFGCR